MDHGVKVTRKEEGSNDANGSSAPKAGAEKPTLPHLLYSLALPYLFGARTQVDRYRAGATILKEQPVRGVRICLHEASCLFEDLATVSKYAEMCGHSHELHKLWFDIRNHIRHDVREELDNEIDVRKNARAKRLGLNPKLQTMLGFDSDMIRVGTKTIQLNTVEEYLNWSEKIIDGVLADAQAKGWIK